MHNYNQAQGRTTLKKQDTPEPRAKRRVGGGGGGGGGEGEEVGGEDDKNDEKIVKARKKLMNTHAYTHSHTNT